MQFHPFRAKTGIAIFSPVLFAFLTLIAGFGSGCNNADGASASAESEERREARIVKVETIRVQSGSFDDYISLTGTVEAVNDVNLSAETGGQLTYVAPLGKVVSPSSIVARIDDRLARSSMEAAMAQYELAEDTFKRQEALYRDSVISALEFETARAQRDQLAAMYRQAQKSLDDTELRSPIAGRVEERMVEAGEMVSPGSPVVRIVNTSNVKIATGVPERYAGDVTIGTPVSAALSVYGQEPRVGEVSFAGNVIDPLSRTFDVEIAFDNPGGSLKPEMVADLSIVRQRIDSALVVPQTAIISDETGSHVFVVDDLNGGLQVVKKRVVPGPGFRGRAVIEDGLSAGDQVVVVGQSTLTTGDRIAIESTHDDVATYLETTKNAPR